jgi:hypothetical protein
MEQEIFGGMLTDGDPLGQAARRGAQLLLQKALEMETEDFLGRVEFPSMIRVAVKVIDSRGKPVEGVAVFYADEDRLSGYTRQSPVTSAEGIALLNIPPNSKGEFLVQSGVPRTRLNAQTTDYLKESTPYQVTGPQDAGKQFTLVLSDEMLKQLFK